VPAHPPLAVREPVGERTVRSRPIRPRAQAGPRARATPVAERTQQADDADSAVRARGRGPRRCGRSARHGRADA
jgi:hypothetical protein